MLIDERDEYMSGKLAALAEKEDPPKQVVAMVGAGHLVGMIQAFNDIKIINFENIEIIKK